MQFTSTFKNWRRLLRIVPILFVLAGSFAQSASAQCVWSTSANYPASALDMPVATVGTNVYAFAGVAGGAIVAASNKFDGTAWTAIAPTPTAIEFPSATSDGTNVFVIGGALVGTGAPQNTNYRYNVGSNTYTTMAPAPTATWNHGAAFLGGKIYKVGGTGAAAVANLDIYDIATNTWSSGAPYPVAVSFPSVAEIGGVIYVAGGIVGGVGSLKTYAYNVGTNSWSDANIADLPATRWGAAGVNYRGFTLAGGYVGGDLTANISATVISWDPATNTWSTQPPMPSDRSRFTGTVMGDALYVVGGRSQSSAAFGGNNTFYKYTCPPLVACTGTPAPGNTFASSQQVCTGTSVTFSAQNATAGTGVTYQWEVAPTVGGTYTNAPGTSTNPTYTTTVSANGCYRVRVTCGANSATSTPICVSVVSCTCITPGAATICEGQIQSLTVTGTGTPGTQTASSGPITVVVPDANAAGITTTLPVSLPAGASINSMSVNFNMTHTWDSDMVFNLVAPNGQIINLASGVGGSGDNFVNTTITSVPGSPVITTGTAPFTATFTAQFAAGAGPTGFVQTANNWAALYSVPSGNWRLAMRDLAGGDVGTLTSWSITFNYSILPTATWTGGAIFTDPAATTPYVAGSQANTVYVMPTSTTTYTATIAAGPCAGANPVTVTVLPRPVVTLSPTSGCGPLTITASGAASYAFTPSAGVTAGTGSTFVANPSSTTTYSVVGTGTNGCTSLPASVTVNAAPISATIAPVAASTFQINENFNAATLPANWTSINNSTAVGTNPNWFKPTGAEFPANSGPANGYVAANFNAVTGNNTISLYYISPIVNIKNGDEIAFFTRTITGPAFPDRLELRLNTNNTSTNVGTGGGVGDFTTLLLTVNPNLTVTGYPSTWTRFSATVTGVTGTVPGRFALRYFVTSGGPAGANSDFIGVDDVTYSTPATANCANTVANLQVTINGGVGPYTVVFSNGTTQTTINNYTSGSNIQVSPAATTTYSIVSVTGANGCTLPTAGIGAPTTFVITPGPSITSQPANTSACLGGNATFTVASGPAVGNNFQWQVSTDGGTTYTNIPGATGSSYTVTGATAAQNNNRYRVIITGSCPSAVTSNGAILTVNTAAVITAQPAASITACAGAGNTITVTATGNQLTYQWQVSTNGGTSYANIANGGTYSGVTTNTLTILNATAAMQGYLYRVLVTSAGCTATTSNSTALTTVFPAPVVVISAAPIRNLFPGLTTTLTAAVSPNAAVTYQWYRNGVAVPGATSNTLVVGIDGIGTYTVAVTDVNGCSNIGRASVPSSIVIGDSVNNETLFIYPSPNNGSFQVRLFTDNNDLNNAPAVVNVYDSKGARVFTRRYTIVSGYNQMNVDLASHGKGIYRVEVTNSIGERLKTGSVYVF